MLLIQASGLSFLSVALNLVLNVLVVIMENKVQKEANGLPSFAHGLQILLVDHDTLALTYMASVLEQYSFRVTTAEQASAALSMIGEQKEEQYKLVMANINMPDMDTLSFLSVLHEVEIPVIFMSSEMNVNVARKALAEGACFFLEKPVPSEDLKNLWQHAYWKMRNPKKNIHKPNCGEKMNHAKEFQGKSKQVDTQDTCKQACSPGKDCVGDGNRERELQSSFTEALVTTESQPQRSSGIKRPIDDKEEQEEAKKIKINEEQTPPESTNKNEEGMENTDSNVDSSSNKKTRAIWTPELHRKFTAALSALGDQKARPKSIQKLMNVPHITVRQVASHLQKYKSQVQRILENATTRLPSLSRLSNCSNRNRFPPPPKPSLLLSQYGQGTSSFGVRGSTTQFINPDSLTRYPISVPSFNQHDYGRQNLNSGHTVPVLFHNTGHHTNIPNEFYSRTHGQVRNLNQIRETSSFNYPADINEIVNKNQPLGLQERSFNVSEMNLPSMNYMTQEFASPYMSANTFQLPNEPAAVNQEQYFAQALTAPFNSHNQNQFSTEFAGTTEVLELVPEQIASGNATDQNKFPAAFNDGSQKLDTTAGEAPPTSSLNNPDLSEYADLLKLLEEDPEEPSCFDSTPNANDVDRYCEWLTKTLFADNADAV